MGLGFRRDKRLPGSLAYSTYAGGEYHSQDYFNHPENEKPD